MSTINCNLKIDKLTQQVNKFKKGAVLKVGFLNKEIANIAMINEYGAKINITDKMRAWFWHTHKVNIWKRTEPIVIPPRPFMATTVKDYSKKWAKMLKSFLKRNDAPTSLKMLGEEIQSDIKNTISNNNFARNAEFTKMVKGRDKPLIDTGEMRNSVAYKVK